MALKKIQNETAKTESILSPFICNYIIDPDRFYIFLSHVTRKGCQSIGCLFFRGCRQRNDRLPGRKQRGRTALDKFHVQWNAHNHDQYLLQGKLSGKYLRISIRWSSACSRFNLRFHQFLLSYAGIWGQSLVVHCWCFGIWTLLL